jgi:flagellar hook-associated protein 2
MRVNNLGPQVGGAGPSGAPDMIDRLMEVERAPVEALKTRRGRLADEKNEYSAFAGLLGELGKAAQGLERPSGFRKMAVESSHPDILNGLVDGVAEAGSYEFEVKGLAQADKFLDVGFPDADKTSVGFGFLGIEKADGSDAEIVINPGSTLRDVAASINDAKAGVRAQIVDTGSPEDPFRLLVTAEGTGEAAKIKIDPDTTFLDMKNIKGAKNLDVKFEDVAVQRGDNKLNDLLQGVKLDAKRAEPGTKVTVNVTHDLDKTLAGIKDFTAKYNQIASYVSTQFQVDRSTMKAGKLAGDGNLRSVMRGLQTQISTPKADAVGKFRSLAEVGIKTNAKTGEL